MLFKSLDGIVAYRMHKPRWSSTPLSGAGAARYGGRANRPGIAALYLSLETDTAIREYQQTSSLLPPGTLVSYRVSLRRVVDFSAGFDSSVWAPLWEQFTQDWRHLWFDKRIEPAGWALGDDVRAAGAAAILFSSAVVAGGGNLVLYPDHFDEEDRVEVFDPQKDLPRDQQSWR